MARRKTTDPEPSLFPFLSVLAAVMGTLVLIIAGMSKLALADPPQRIELDEWDPGKKSPIYVECRSFGVLVYPDDPTSASPERVAHEELSHSTGAWASLLSRLGQDPGHYLLFLIRKDGVGTFETARAAAVADGIEVGYEPVFGDNPVRFRPRRIR
ncbi:MAG: hypothetical protein R3B70_03535 [Polyangiaceae bacterium]